MLTRLQDRKAGATVIQRWGRWGTSSEIEKRGDKYFVVHKNKQEKEFPSLVDAERYLRDMGNR